MSLNPSDTIAAVASPPGAGLRGVVRLSGPAAWGVALAGFAPERVALTPTARAERRTGSYRLDGLRPALPASVWLWPGPRTYTGQTSAEVHTVGSPPLLQLVLAHCLARGARPAEPGEFTLRAFLAGRIDLTRAEAVLAVVEARNPAQLQAALGQLAGGLAAPVTAARDRLLDVLAHVEAGLDFIDEPDVDPLGRAALAAELARASAELDALSDRLRGRDRPGGHPLVVLTGPPNAGKSRLFNALIGPGRASDRALVSARPGTTRDYLSARVACDGLTVELIDTAGEEDPSSRVEVRAQALRAEQAARADLLLDCRPAAGAFAPVIDRPCLRVRTKADLAPAAPEEPGVLSTSAATGEGLDSLRVAMASALRAAGDAADLPTTTAARCRDGLARAAAALGDAAGLLALGGGEELVAIDLRLAVDELGKVVGAVVTDDVLDRIFRRFCIGK